LETISHAYDSITGVLLRRSPHRDPFVTFCEISSSIQMRWCVEGLPLFFLFSQGNRFYYMADEGIWCWRVKISYHDLQLDYDFSNNSLKYYLRFVPLFHSKDGDTLVLRSSQEREAILYNWRDHRVERTSVTVHKTSIDVGTTSYLCWDFGKGFVESLIWICWILKVSSSSMVYLFEFM